MKKHRKSYRDLCTCMPLGISRRGLIKLIASSLCVHESIFAKAYGVTASKGPPNISGPATRAVLNLPRETLTLLTGRQLQLRQVMQYLYNAGFVAEDSLIAGTAIAIAESQLYVAARNWHPEKGYRPMSDAITVKGPSVVWRAGSQLHSDRGLWQVASYWHSHYPDSGTDDPALAAAMVYELSERATNFSLWTSFSEQNAQKHFDRSFHGWPALRPLVKQFLNLKRINSSAVANTTTDDTTDRR